MTGSLGPCGQHPRSARRSWAHPAGRALRPGAARRCTPRRPCVCTPWPTGLRYGSASAGWPRRHLPCAGALGSPSAFPRSHVLDWGKVRSWMCLAIGRHARPGLTVNPPHLLQLLLSFYCSRPGAGSTTTWETVGRVRHRSHT